MGSESGVVEELEREKRGMAEGAGVDRAAGGAVRGR